MPYYFFTIRSTKRSQFIDVSGTVLQYVRSSNIKEGLCHVYVPHTTAGVTINESADPDVVHDILVRLSRLVPDREGYRHAEGNSDAHIKASLMGSSAMVPVHEGNLALGTWQGIFLCEFDGPRQRSIYVTVMDSGA
ncbi:MAG: YjbQ family protein [Spirochaetales bacterium]|nr:YjbQ family protein [Spirochaetales bacterium]